MTEKGRKGKRERKIKEGKKKRREGKKAKAK